MCWLSNLYLERHIVTDSNNKSTKRISNIGQCVAVEITGSVI